MTVRDASGYEREQRRPSLRLRFVVVPTFLDEIRATMHYPDGIDPLPDLCRAGLVVLDDFGREKPTEWATERLYVLINHRYNHRLPTIVTSNFTPQQLADRGYGPHISRLVEGTKLIRLDAPDYRRAGQ